MDESDSRRDAIDNLLQELGPPLEDNTGIIVGWAIVCDWMDDEGRRWLTKAHSSSVAAWQASGMHWDALHGKWPEDEDDE